MMHKLGRLNHSFISIELKMFDHGWAALIFKYDQLEISIDLSDVYDPFQDLVNWGGIFNKIFCQPLLR